MLLLLFFFCVNDEKKICFIILIYNNLKRITVISLSKQDHYLIAWYQVLLEGKTFTLHLGCGLFKHLVYIHIYFYNCGPRWKIKKNMAHIVKKQKPIYKGKISIQFWDRQHNFAKLFYTLFQYLPNRSSLFFFFNFDKSFNNNGY